MESSDNSGRTKVFISYSHQDARYLKRLQVHLAPYSQNMLIDLWVDTMIIPGTRWREEITGAIASAKVAVLLTSADFLASRFIAEVELPLLLTAAKDNGTIILPIILSPCALEDTKIVEFQSMNMPSVPLTKMNNHQKEAFWKEVARFIRDAAFLQR